MILTACVEMPQNTTWKMEHDKIKDYIKIDRPLNQPVPHNYGYIESDNLQEDGDPIDCFVLTDSPIYPLTRVQVELIGVIKCMDNGKRDDKLVALVVGDYRGFETTGVGGIIKYLETYKEGFTVIDYFGKEEAEIVYNGAVKMYADQRVYNDQTFYDLTKGIL